MHGKSIRWRLGNFINCGTFGQVFRAMNIDTGEIMAVRKLIIGERRDKQFLKEIEVGFVFNFIFLFVLK